MHIRENLGVSERRACHVLGQAWATQRYAARIRADEDALTGAVIEGLRPIRASEQMAKRLA